MKIFEKRNLLQITFFIFAIFFLPAALHAEYNHFNIPDSTEIRKQIVDDWFLSDIENLRLKNSQIRKNSIGQEFQISFEEQDQNLIIFVTPPTKIKVDVYDNSGIHTQIEDSFVPNSFGSWMFVRDKNDENLKFIRLYVCKNPNVYIEIKPFKNICVADFIVYDAFITKSISLGIPFENLFTISIEELYSISKKNLPWKYVEYFLNQYEEKLVMIQTLRSLENKIAYEEDAMYDEFGKPVSIRTGQPFLCKEENKNKIVLSSGGFVKWVVDGLVEPLAGSYLRRAPLIEKTFEYKENGFQGSLNSIYSTNFSLDWTRNLAAAAYSVRAKKTYLYKDIQVDVTAKPFTFFKTEKGIINTVGYVKNSGYKPEFLKPLLYTFALDEPEYFYLAAIRQTDRAGKENGSEVKVFNDAAVIFPYLDKNGIFKIVVFMDGKEIKYEDFEKFLIKTNDCFVHLTKVKASKTFYPQDKNSF